MRNIWAILPIKASSLSKRRLSSLLNDDECGQLAEAMMLDVIEMLQTCSRIKHIAVVTADKNIAAIARQQGCLIFGETTQGLNENLTVVANELQDKNVEGILILPGDLPTLDPAEVDAFIATHTDGDGISICPAEKDGGTNALLCTPPAVIGLSYGADSAAKHIAAAEAKHVKCQQQFLPSLQSDIDEPDDLRWLVNKAIKAEAGVATSQYLAGSGISERLLHNKPKEPENAEKEEA